MNRYTERNRRRRFDNRRRIAAYKKGKRCQWRGCLVSDSEMLTFDHIDPALKKLHVSDMANGYTWNTIELEIRKCRILCFNHHMKHTARQRRKQVLSSMEKMETGRLL